MRVVTTYEDLGISNSFWKLEPNTARRMIMSRIELVR
jgi:hypothetical protein